MITAWRIVKAKHLKAAFSGEGARIYGGRWNSVGIPLVYTSETISLAVLELVVHVNEMDLLLRKFVKIPVSFDESMVQVFPREKLPKNWNDLPPTEATQRIGNKWFREGQYAVLKVPSAVTPEEHNFLLNPIHKDFSKIKFGKSKKIKIDKRIIKKL
jgi:RES domain-containing protein